MTRADPRDETRRSLAEFIRDETTGGIVLFGATAAALLWANLAPGAYEDFWSTTVGPGSLLHLHLDLHAWVNDGLMTLFFFVVGLEIKRELVVGELKNARNASMPMIAAFGGMVVPAIIFLAFNPSGATRGGWGIPIATDIAFVLGVLSLLGSRVPSGLRLFLLAIAIIDDIGAIVVIAVFYSDGVDFGALAGAGGVVLAVVALRRMNVTRPVAYVLPALALWALLHQSGVHATIGGVALGLLTPTGRVDGRPLLDDLQHRLHPFSALVVVPLFALANAGVNVHLDSLRDAVTSRVAWGVVVGLVAGKAVGIAGATLLARRMGVGALPAGVGTRQVIGGAAVAGIGFTVALFIADLTFGGSEHLTAAKVAILGASLVAGGLGATILMYRAPRAPN